MDTNFLSLCSLILFALLRQGESNPFAEKVYMLSMKKMYLNDIVYYKIETNVIIARAGMLIIEPDLAFLIGNKFSPLLSDVL
jgi:hypothetical protein